MKSLCEICGINSGTVSSVISGVYYKSVCSSCNGKSATVSSGHARWSRSVDVEDHQADLLQPHNADGSINAEFCKRYPQQSKAVFTDEQIVKALRS